MTPDTMIRTKLPALLAVLVAFLVLALSPSAFAQAQQPPASGLAVSDSDPNPVTNSPVTFTVTSAVDCTPSAYDFSVDGTPQPRQTSNKLTTTFSTTGDHTVSVTATYCGNGMASDSRTITVGTGVSGTISTSPDPARPGESAALSVTPSGGVGLVYTGYRWTVDGVADPAGDDNRSYSRTFTAGSHTVKVTFSDSADPPHTGSATRTISVEAPAPPPPGSPAPPPPAPAPPCKTSVVFALSEFTTNGCFDQVAGSSPTQWTTTSRVTLNGIPFADSGQRFVITEPSADDPGGHVKSDNAAIQLDRFIPFSGNVDWSLPAGKEGDPLGTLREVSVPSYARLFKLRVAGSIKIQLGFANGRHFASFPLNVELPPAFTAGESKFSGGVTGTASISADGDGIHYDGLKVEVQKVWVGKLEIAEACFSYVPAGGQAVEPCATPTVDNKPYITCATDVNTDRFDASATIVLPTKSSTSLAAFGGLADGQVSKLGGLVDHIGTAIPIVPGVFLNRVGAGLCLSPPPFKLKGSVGVTALAGQLDVNGDVTYTDATDSSPWRVDVSGSAVFKDIELGHAMVGFNAWGDVDFDVDTKLDLGDVATVSGDVNGWIEPRNSTFNIAGTVQASIAGGDPATASGLVSNVGVAGCVDLGTFTIPLPDEVREGPFGFGSIVIITHDKTIHLQAGAGYVFATKTASLLGNSCDFSPYMSTRSVATGRAAGVGLAERIRPGTRAVTLRIHGTNGPPKVVVRGPHGTTITSPADARAAQSKGHYFLAENKSDGTTSVLVIKPAAGTWTVAAAPGSTSTPTRLDRSNLQAPSVLFGQVRQVRGGVREAAVEYAVPAGASLRLAERGKGIGRTLVGSVRGTRCRGVHTLPDGRHMLCARVRFRPSLGPGGTRQVQALVSRDGMPITQKTIATFQAPRETLPARPAPLRARRSRGSLVVQFAPIPGVSRYSAVAHLSDGRELGFDLKSTCRAVRIGNVPLGVGATVTIAGVRYDLSVGRTRSVSLGSTASSVGKPTRPRKQWRALEPCT